MTFTPTDETDPMREQMARAIYESMQPQYIATVSVEGAVNGPRRCTWDGEPLMRKEYVYRYADAALAVVAPMIESFRLATAAAIRGRMKVQEEVDALKAERDAVYAQLDNTDKVRRNTFESWQQVERELAAVVAERDSLAGRLGEATKQLAECYRLSGADPDDNEDWRLAPEAVKEVTQMRKEWDAAELRAERAEGALAKGCPPSPSAPPA